MIASTVPTSRLGQAAEEALRALSQATTVKSVTYSCTSGGHSAGLVSSVQQPGSRQLSDSF
jgi:hypothetical protein